MNAGSRWNPFWLLLCLSVTACSSAIRLPVHAPHEDVYRLGPGDVVSVSVWHEPQLASKVIVRPDGMISLPLVKDIPAAGMSAQELSKALASRYKDFVVDPEVSVDVVEINSYRVAVLGRVKTPGEYSLLGGSDVMHLVASAGGLDIFATGYLSVIRHNGGASEEYTVNFDQILKGDLKQDIILRPGDVLVAL